MKVTLKCVTVESRHLHHTVVTWVQVPPETAFAYVTDVTCHNEWALDKTDATLLTSKPLLKYQAVCPKAIIQTVYMCVEQLSLGNIAFAVLAKTLEFTNR